MKQGIMLFIFLFLSLIIGGKSAYAQLLAPPDTLHNSHVADSLSRLSVEKQDSAFKHTYIYVLLNKERFSDSLRPGIVERGYGRIRSESGSIPSFFIYLFITAFLILALCRLLNTDYFGRLIYTLTNTGQLFALFQEGSFGFNFSNLALDFSFILSLSILIQRLFFLFHSEYFIFIFVIVAGAYYFKIILIQLFAFLFFDQLDALLHVLFNLLFTRVMGLIMLPFVFFCIYQTKLEPVVPVKIAFIALLIIYAVWLVRLLVKMKLEGVSGIFYLILYLCALEVFPVLILIKKFLA